MFRYCNLRRAPFVSMTDIGKKVCWPGRDTGFILLLKRASGEIDL